MKRVWWGLYVVFVAVAFGLLIVFGLPAMTKLNTPVPAVAEKCYEPASWDHSGC